ncbi:hypothetical protein P8C59_000450 [Phyllachora maydis]|uniref:Abscisic acid G-protein coupled receptor-like domain-containing protein n=1 Tax=Phyllachora maydis TaxID=1825666 RepID=A0AAD9HWC6_9PEZI|nr:hypothetical protein P8C59_000450 [Phyllachora maydis]
MRSPTKPSSSDCGDNLCLVPVPPTALGTVISLGPFIATFAAVSLFVARRVFPHLSRTPSGTLDGEDHYLPASAPPTLQQAHAEHGARSLRRRVAAATFAATVGLATVLAELILSEMSELVSPHAREVALRLTVPTLLFVLVVLIPFLELQSFVTGSGWSFQRSAKGRTPRMAWTLQAVAFGGYAFSLYCIYRILATTLSSLRRVYYPSASFSSSDPINRFLGLLAKHWDPKLDQIAWARQISFLLSGVILAASANSVLQTFHLFAKWLPGLLYQAQANFALLIGQIAATYVISAALLLRSHLPKEMGRSVGDALESALEPGFVDRWFEGWFLVASVATAAGIWVGRKIGSDSAMGGGEWDELDEYGREEIGGEKLDEVESICSPELDQNDMPSIECIYAYQAPVMGCTEKDFEKGQTYRFDHDDDDDDDDDNDKVHDYAGQNDLQDTYSPGDGHGLGLDPGAGAAQCADHDHDGVRVPHLDQAHVLNPEGVRVLDPEDDPEDDMDDVHVPDINNVHVPDIDDVYIPDIDDIHVPDPKGAHIADSGPARYRYYHLAAEHGEVHNVLCTAIPDLLSQSFRVSDRDVPIRTNTLKDDSHVGEQQFQRNSNALVLVNFDPNASLCFGMGRQRRR